MWRITNDEGYHEDTLHLIVDVRFNTNAVKDSFIYDKHDKRQMGKTMTGFDILVAIKDGVNLDDGSKKVSKDMDSSKGHEEIPFC